MGRFKDLTGKRIGRLVVVSKSTEKCDKGILWVCICDCGNIKEVKSHNLRETRVKSCGCLIKDSIIPNQVKATNKGRFEGTKIGIISSKKVPSNNSSGYKGVRWNKNANKWISRINFRGKEIHLGVYEYLEDAIKVRKEAEELYFNPLIKEYQIKQMKKEK